VASEVPAGTGVGPGVHANLDEVAQPHGRSIQAGLERPARRGSEGGAGGRSGPNERLERLPAPADLVASEWPALAIEPAVADLRGD
jgi:hypothetical protein